MRKVGVLLGIIMLIYSCHVETHNKIKLIKIYRFKPYYDTTEIMYDDSTNNRLSNLSDTSKLLNIRKNIRKSFLVEGDFIQDSTSIDSMVYVYLLQNPDLINTIHLKGYFTTRFEFFRANDFLDISYNQATDSKDLIFDPKNLIAAFTWSNSKLIQLEYFNNGEWIGIEYSPKRSKFNFDSNNQ